MQRAEDFFLLFFFNYFVTVILATVIKPTSSLAPQRVRSLPVFHDPRTPQFQDKEALGGGGRARWGRTPKLIVCSAPTRGPTASPVSHSRPAFSRGASTQTGSPVGCSAPSVDQSASRSHWGRTLKPEVQWGVRHQPADQPAVVEVEVVGEREVAVL